MNKRSTNATAFTTFPSKDQINTNLHLNHQFNTKDSVFQLLPLSIQQIDSLNIQNGICVHIKIQQFFIFIKLTFFDTRSTYNRLGCYYITSNTSIYLIKSIYYPYWRSQ